MGKERETPSGTGPELEITDVHSPEIELRKEVAAAGVKAHPTVVAIPPAVAQLGVQAIGSNSPAPTGQAVVLPLSDDQITQALHADVTSSLRWLAEWCVRKLKQLHQAATGIISSKK